MKKLAGLFLALVLLVSALSALADGQNGGASYSLGGEWSVSDIRWGERRTPVSVYQMNVQFNMSGYQFVLVIPAYDTDDGDVLTGYMTPINGNSYKASVANANGRYELTFVLNGNQMTVMILKNGRVYALFTFISSRIPVRPTAAPTQYYPYWPTERPTQRPYQPTPTPVPLGRVVTPYRWDTQFVLGMSKYSEKMDRSATLPNMYDDDPWTFYSWTVWTSDRSDNLPEFTAYFDGRTISSVAIRNGNARSSSSYYDNARPRRLKLVIYYGSQQAQTTITLPDHWSRDYQVFGLGDTYQDVTRIELWLDGFATGRTDDGLYCCCVSDIQFCQ